MSNLAGRLAEVFELLKQTQPTAPIETDVVWNGPYYIPRRLVWGATRFVLYRGTLYASLSIGSGHYGLSWKLESDEWKFEGNRVVGDYINGEPLWVDALIQVSRRLRFALQDPLRYNRMVQTRLPSTCRTGKIRRELTWPRDAKPPLASGRIRRLIKVLTVARQLSRLEKITLSDYLATVEIAFDVAFKDFRSLSRLEKYKRKADGRHGGLLDLPPDDAKAFSEWFNSRRWTGTHPWEIVFGHPHGIMISPRYHTQSSSWSYVLWVGSLAWYATAARMAIALGGRRIPFEFGCWEGVVAALQGADEVDVGPDLYSVRYDELKEHRPDGLPLIRWDPIPQITAITDDQSARLSAALRGAVNGCADATVDAYGTKDGHECELLSVDNGVPLRNRRSDGSGRKRPAHRRAR